MNGWLDEIYTILTYYLHSPQEINGFTKSASIIIKTRLLYQVIQGLVKTFIVFLLNTSPTYVLTFENRQWKQNFMKKNVTHSSVIRCISKTGKAVNRERKDVDIDFKFWYLGITYINKRFFERTRKLKTWYCLKRPTRRIINEFGSTLYLYRQN